MSPFVANLLALLGYENTNVAGEGLEPALAAYDAMCTEDAREEDGVVA
jgi:hypothetical protein